MGNRADQKPAPAQQRYRAGGNQEWRGDPQAHGLRLHPCRTRRTHSRVLQRALESLSELPSSLRPSRYRSTQKRRATAPLPTLSNPAGALPGPFPARPSSTPGTHHRRSPTHRCCRQRYRSCPAHAASQSQTLRAVAPASRRAVAMTVAAKPCGFRTHLGNRFAIPTLPQPRRLLDSFNTKSRKELSSAIPSGFLQAHPSIRKDSDPQQNRFANSKIAPAGALSQLAATGSVSLFQGFRPCVRSRPLSLPKHPVSFYTKKFRQKLLLRSYIDPPEALRRGGCMRHFSAAQTVAALFSVLLLGVWVGCSGTSTPANPVTSIVMTPASVSMNVGQVIKITGVPKNYAGTTIAADVSYASSNTSQITISPIGYICAGVWDANYINCNALPGKTGVATATITATSGSTSATAPVFTHLQVDQISVTPPTGCVSVGGTPTYTAAAYNKTATGCSLAIPCDIAPTVGPISFYSTDLTVMGNNSTTGILTADEPGSTTIYASVAGLNSTPQPALVCPVVSINVHDAASTNTTFSLAPTATQALVADVIDSAGVAIRPALTWNSVPAGVASVTLGTSTTTNSGAITANTAGTSIITVTCTQQNCNRNTSHTNSKNA